MSIQSNFPNLKPSLLLDFANTKQLDNRVTFTRSTPAVYYDGKTTAMAEQNLLLYSQDFNSWSSTGLTLTANTTTAPDGTTTADTMTATSYVPYLYIGVDAITKVGTYTFSCYVKAGTNNFVALNIQGTATSWVTAVYNLSTGAVTQTGNGGSGLATINTTSITSVGSSWYRCVLTASCTSAVLVYPAVMFAASATGNTLSANYGETSGNTVGNTLFVWGAQIEARSSATAYTATTTQPITNYIPVLLSAGGNQARFDHNPTTGESLGLLIEEQRTNGAGYSADLGNNSAWPAASVTTTSNANIAPDGSLSAMLMASSTFSGDHDHYKLFSLSAITYTFSVYAKYSGEHLALSAGASATSGVPWAGCIFDLQNGVAKTPQGSGITCTANIQSVGNGWYRCSITFTSTAAGYYLIISNTNNVNATMGTYGFISYTGNNWNGTQLWGAQLEEGAFATSYIATTSASATRTADAASMTGTNFSSWFNNAEGTLYWDMRRSNTSASPEISLFNSTNGSYYGAIALLQNTAGGNIKAYSLADSTEYVNMTIASGLTGVSPIRTAYAYKANDFAGSSNGQTVVTDSVGLVQTGANILAFSQSVLNGFYYISKFVYYPLRLSNTNLVALTS